MATLGALVVSLEANMARFTQDMDRAANQTEKAMGQMKGAANMVTGALALIGVGLSFGALIGEANKAIDALADLDDMAQKTGASVELLSKLGKVAAMTGQDFGAVDDAITKLAKGMATADEKGSKFTKAMQALGISTKDIAKQDPAKLFVDISNKLQGFADGAGKTALAQDAMGKSGAALLPYMNDVSEHIDKFSGATKESAAQASAYKDSLGLMRVKYDEVTASIVTAALPAASDFVGALADLINGSDGVTGIDVAGWADDVAMGLANAADVAANTVRIFSAVSSSIRVVIADINVLAEAADSINPNKAAARIASGGNAFDGVKKAVAEREIILKEANTKLDSLINDPADRFASALEKRMAARTKALAGGAAAASGGGGGKTELKYGSGEDGKKTGKSEAEKAIEEGAKLITKLKEQRDAYDLTGAGLLEYQLTQSKMPNQYKEEALAIQTTIDNMKAKAEIAAISAEVEKKAQEDAKRAMGENAQNVEQIRLGLLSEVDAEQEAHEKRLEQLRMYDAMNLEQTIEANALIEAEVARHEETKAAAKKAGEQNIIDITDDAAGQLYDSLKQAGLEQTALAKAAFLVQKAIAVQKIITSTNVGAAAALEYGPIAGPIMAAAIYAMGYASAGLVAGQAIASVSAEGGYDIPAGTNPVAQLHEKEMVLPKAQADVIRGLAANGGGSAGGMKLTIVNQTTGRIDTVTEKQISPTEKAIIIQEAVSATAAQFADPNSQTSRSMSRHYNVPRSR